MISYSGYEGLIEKVYQQGQGHVFEYWEKLDDRERRILLDTLQEIDFELLKRLYEETGRDDVSVDKFGPAPFLHWPRTGEEQKNHEVAARTGIDAIRTGRIGAFLVAGGQGTRLGYDGPKGKFPVGPVSGKTLFAIHAEKVLKYSIKYQVSIPLMVMTSRGNHEETLDYFKKKHFFDLDEGSVMIFPQSMIPSLDEKGKIILESGYGIFMNPDGHGGSITALHSSGALEFLEKRGIDIISYFQVDNPLVRIIDPVFIGFHIMNNAEVSSKGLMKTSPDEKVGVFVRYDNGRIGILEYSDLSEELQSLRDEKGELLYAMGNPAIHLFNREFLEKITSGKGATLPYHVARKKIGGYIGGAVKEIIGFKFEKFVFDALPMTDRNIIYETLREEEFAPVKNRSGIDSVETSQALMDRLFRKWLLVRNIAVPPEVKAVEISPLLAVEPSDLPDTLKLKVESAVYLT